MIISRSIQKIKSVLSYPVFFVILIALHACEEDYQVLPEIPKPECFLLSAVKSGGVTFTRGSYQLEYDNEGHIIKYLENDSTLDKFEYENNRVVRISSYSKNDEAQLMYVKRILYNSKGQWVKMDYADPGMGYTTAEYDHEGYLVKIVSGGSVGKARSVFTYKYSQGNLIKMTQTSYKEDGSKGSEQSTGYTYDLTNENKLEYLHAQLLLVEPSYGTVLWHTTSKNMIQTSFSYEPGVGTLYFQHEYDDKGFPTKRTLSGVDYNQDGIIDENDTVIILFTYSCP